MIRFAQYPTYQVFLAVVMAMVSAALLFPLWIRLLRVRNIGQQVRADGPQGHLVKQGTPTMGGVLILLVVAVTFLLMGTPTRTSLLVLLRHAGLRDPRVHRRLVQGESRALAGAASPGEARSGRAVVAVVFGLLAVNWADLPTWVRFR